MVVYSERKAIRGPQRSEPLCGRAELFEAAAANASLHQFIGRGLRVVKGKLIQIGRMLEYLD